MKTILSNLSNRLLPFTLAACFVLAAVAFGQNQDMRMPTVQSVDVSFRGTENISREAVVAHIKLQDGMEYDQNLVDQSIRSLYQTGLYDFIEVKRDVLPGNKIALTFIVTPKYRVTSISFEGNEHVRSSKLRKDIDTKVGGVLNEVTIKRDADKIFDLYQKKGYSEVEVQYFVDKDSSTGEGAVRFEITEGPRMHISKIKFVGNEHIKSKKLLKVMQTRKWNFLSWISGTGRFQEDEFSEDLDRLVDYYKDQGYLDVYIPPYEVSFEYPKQDSMVIVIHIEEGRQYHIGNITVSGNTLYPTDRLMEVLTVKAGDVFSPSKVDRNAEDLKDFYGQYGYLDTVVRAERVPDLQSGDIGLNFSIRESEQFHLESIHIDGNTKTRFNVILRELALQPGEVFDLVRMKNSQTRLQNTRYFDEVILSPEETNIPGRRNMKITVKEARTGSFNFGLAFSSVENAVAFAELTQSNFDLFNYRNRFQGAGDKFRLRLALGTKSNEVTLHYEKPWLYDRKLTFGFEAFRRETDYVSTVYNEMRYGFEFYFSKRLIELIDGRIFYRLEEAKIFDVSESASTVIKSQEGLTTISKVGVSFARDTRDSLINPTKGSRLGFLTEVAGLGGNVDYIRVEGAAGRWWPTFEAGNQVFALVGRTGTITPYNGKSVPFFEKYFLGGPYNLRGYKYRDVGPRAPNGDVIGGDTMAYGSAEYSVEIIEPIRVAGFYDGGFVNSSDWDWSTDDYQHDLGAGLRIFIFGAPLRLDFAYPLNVTGGQQRKLNFNFSFGTVF